MNRIPALLLLAGTALSGQTSTVADLLKRTDELETSMAAGEWGKASELSRSLKDAITEARDEALASSGRELADSVLNWLPPDTETLVVAEKPFSILKEDRTTIPTALGAAQGYVLGLLGAAEHGHMWEALLGRTVKAAALGARHFANHPPGENDTIPLGMIAYEGCAVYGFTGPLPESIVSRPTDDSVMGHRVWVSKGSQSDRPNTDTYLVSLLQPDLMMVCNNREFFQEVVSRRTLPQKTRALPADLPEWKQLDRSAALWAVSHYRTDGLIPQMVSQDSDDDVEATGITVEFGLATGGSRARMISKADPWINFVGTATPGFPDSATSRKVSEGVWELSLSGDPQNGLTAVFMFMAMVGFAVLL